MSTIQKRIGKLLADATARCARPREGKSASPSARLPVHLSLRAPPAVHLTLCFLPVCTCLCAIHWGALVFAFSITPCPGTGAQRRRCPSQRSRQARWRGTVAEQCFVAVGTKPAERAKMFSALVQHVVCAKGVCVGADGLGEWRSSRAGFVKFGFWWRVRKTARGRSR